MKIHLILAVMPVLLAACGKSVITTMEKVVVKTVGASTPTARKEKKMENLVIIVYPPGTRGTTISHPIPPLPSAYQTMSPAKQQ